ncbi:MAG TPA: PilC/PilY family type IV pilus protein [Burkholderiales bacterium]|nr:PilC/PilY family type IV pilus protein [Burkholderiales bacterium]
MKPSLHFNPRPAALRALAAAVALGAAAAAHAQLTDLSNVPLQTSVSTAVRPNLMYILDASGSMGGDHLPDYVSGNHCRGDDGNTFQDCSRGDVPWYASAFNGNYYNPQVTYAPPPMPVGWTGTNFVPQNAANTTNWTQVWNNPFLNATAKDNIATAYREVYACDGNSYDASCKRNGINTSPGAYVPFNYWTQGLPFNSGNPDEREYADNSNPHYYDIIPQEFCSDLDMTTCQATQTAVFAFPSYVRFCRTTTAATQAAVPTGGSPALCIGKYIDQGATQWTRPRYGKFQRVDIVPATATYAGRPSRTDCVGAPTCTYAEEMTNFANWYAYYRTRMQMMKSATGHAFIDLDDRYRIGFITIRPGNDVNNSAGTGNPVNAARFQPVATFDSAQKLVFFQKLYAQTAGSYTPLREALSRVGRYFAKQTGGINTGMNTGVGLDKDPVEYSCQQNFALLTTDGYWNTEEGRNLSGGSMSSTNVDNTNAGYAKRADGAYDGGIAGSTGTLADVALYYYQTDLRTTALGNCTSGATGLNICQNNVPTSPTDVNDTQHMVTFTLGLVDGLMRYQPDYDTATNSDLARIKSGTTGCFWSGSGASGTCNWPVPQQNLQSALDDLWHAAVNGRGKYYNARDPETLAFGLKNALSSVVSQVAAAAAAATSTPNINQFDNFVFSSTYRTVTWDGEVIARNIDPATGNVLPTVVWSAQTQLDAVAPAARKIYVRNGTSFANFDFATLPGAVQGFFTNKCSLLSQCTDLTATQQATVNDGTTLVNYLRGDKTNEPDLFRQRDHILGDTVNAVPVYVSKPNFQFGDAVTPNYGAFKAAQASRTPALYVGANDGMLHAFNGTTGAEMWAYVPTMVMANMPLLGDKNYSIKHTYLVDGTATVMDAYFGGAWHTVLVAGLNKGGQGFYALDVTDPANPLPLWEMCTDATLCTSADPNIGFTFGNPVITKRQSDDKWVALLTSGYNNADGQGWLYVVDLQTGAILDKVSTLAGSTGTPSGLAKVTGLANNFAVDNTVLAVYAGDLLGNVWKFDMTVSPPTVQRLALTTDPGGVAQPITTRPEITRINSELVLYVTTGEYLGLTDLATIQTQTVYAFKDTDADLGALRANSGMLTNTPVVNPDGSVTIPAGFNVNWTSQVGWYVDLPRAGERVNIDPQLIQGTLLVVSNQPDTNACSTGGQSFFYQFDYANPTAISSSTNGTTLGVKIGSAVAVGLTVIKLPSGAVKALIPTADTKIQSFEVHFGSGSVSTRRIGWRQLF